MSQVSMEARPSHSQTLQQTQRQGPLASEHPGVWRIHDAIPPGGSAVRKCLARNAEFQWAVEGPRTYDLEMARAVCGPLRGLLRTASQAKFLPAAIFGITEDCGRPVDLELTSTDEFSVSTR